MPYPGATPGADAHGRVGRSAGEEPDLERVAELRASDVDDFAALGSALPLGVISAVGMGTVVYVNDTASSELGRPEDELLGRLWESAIHPDDRAELTAAIALVLDTAVRQRVVIRPADVPERWLELTIAFRGQRDRPTGWIATLDDVSERVRLDEHLAHLATHDPLTMLPNRTLLADRMELAGERLARAGDLAAVALLFVDLDDFKGVNDRYGHAVGDQVLLEVARRLIDAVRGTDTVARLGGDEFVVLCELTEADEVTDLVDRVRSTVHRPVPVAAGSVSVTVSIGVAVAVHGVTDLAGLLDVADQDMYRKKAARVQADPA